ncbi:MAG: hypothetical protein NZ700_17560 [Gemmataceae bacterium]|nr:hypothetical protein [Gemmataceae bacterium]MDW8266143.1 hypothetical protein [Gemmataceae bacterium]
MSTGSHPQASNVKLLITLVIVGGVLILGIGAAFITVMVISHLGTTTGNAPATVARAGTQPLGLPPVTTSPASPAAQAPDEVARGFLQELTTGQLEKAHSRLVGVDGGRVPTLAEFRAEIDRFPTLKQARSRSLNEVHSDANTATYKGKVRGDDESVVEVTIELVRQQGEWRIARFSIP